MVQNTEMAVLNNRLSTTANEVEHRLMAMLSQHTGPDLPARLDAAIRHALLNGGKRIRPFLALESANIFDVPPEQPWPTALALELVHSYSLVHDDLPDMDNDALRRGKPTVHVAFDPATAILTGDALLTLAFDLMAHPSPDLDPAVQLQLIRGLGKAAGWQGMIAGQLYDLASEGRFARPHATGADEVRNIQRLKTGALLRFACEVGPILAAAAPEEGTAMQRYGDRIGLVFQIQDDILDRTASAEQMGKATGKDHAAGKATFVDLHGLDGARQLAAQLVVEAQAELQPFGTRAQGLMALAQFIAHRRN